jgi:broad specificity phosphatase PhoE
MADELRQDLTRFIESVQAGDDTSTILAITSNGILRFFPALLGIDETVLLPRQLKVKTGHFCGFFYEKSQWKLNFWNADPASLDKIT